MGNAEAPLSGAAPGSAQGFRDSLGERQIVAGSGPNEQLEILCLRRELTAVSSFEFALRERAARLANFQHTGYARVRQIDRMAPPDGRLAIVSQHVPGWRLIEIPTAVQEQHLELDINAALCLIKELVHAVAILHQHARGVAHGAIGPERVVVTAHARLAIVEYVLGSALERLEMTREALWRELRIAVPPSAGASRFDARTDVTQLGTIAMALVLGCPLASDDYPDHMAELLAMATENRALGGRRPLSKGLRTWLARALQLDLRHSFQSAIEAESELEALLAAEPSYVAAPVALETFLAEYQRSPRASLRTADAVEDREEVPDESVITLPGRAQQDDAAIDLDSVIGDLDRLLDEASAEKPTVVDLPGRTPASHARVTPERIERPQPAPAPSAPAAHVRPALPGPPSVPVAEPLRREEAKPVGSAADKPVAPPPRPPVVEKAPPGAPKPDLDHGYPGGFESLFGQPGGAAAAEERRSTDEDRRSESAGGRKKKLLLVLAAAAVIVLAVGGYFLYQLFAPGPPVPATGTLVVESQPAGLAVTVDGTPRGATPVRLTLPSGVHKLELDTGGQVRAIPITITAGSQVSQYIEAQATPATGRLAVASEPAGAIVFVDGQRKGPAPLTINELAVGKHRVELQANGANVQQEVTIEPGATNSLVVPMSSVSNGPVSGWLSVSSPVELQVFEGDRLVGSSLSDRVLMTAGRHDIDLVNETLGYRSSQTVVVTPGRVAPVKVQLPKGTLSINALPWAEVFVDGQRVGETPIGNLSLTIGPHEVLFKHPQFAEQRHAVTVTAKVPARVSVDLRK